MFITLLRSLTEICRQTNFRYGTYYIQPPNIEIKHQDMNNIQLIVDCQLFLINNLAYAKNQQYCDIADKFY